MLMKNTFAVTLLGALSVSSGTTIENRQKLRMDDHQFATPPVSGSSSSTLISSSMVEARIEAKEQGGNWCPINRPFTGDYCGWDLPENREGGQCSYSKFITTNGQMTTDSQNCACSLIDPVWRCENKNPDPFIHGRSKN
ncbi:hypothetical protein FRACYDRAFT_250960 [Fragilariopsis cylindrus CCMP1102]|uniref:Uncharacterized protein n=1 Tax=Fragilariopsis cylindrus CCMP1102 TaxID=635003 RepID=A0A1E7ENY8_9STRA|nr:hypothetical protein FRACYDRAFT_250960 [Fragilariopsis cylindrus CCMP1102]|eukprot:OEU07536.1 hypothetical protein FRACYDRAFT_250960 [Fragilariopsis cylindrus CCMP1102]